MIAFLSIVVFSVYPEKTIVKPSVVMHQQADQCQQEIQEDDIDNEILEENLVTTEQKRSFIRKNIDSVRLFCTLSWYKIKETCAALYVYCTTKKK